MTKFEEGVRALINSNSLENASNTPDFILAEYLQRCLEAFDFAVARRENWYGRGPLSGAINAAPPPESHPDD